MINLNKKWFIFFVAYMAGVSCYADNSAPVVKSYCVVTSKRDYDSGYIQNTKPTNTEITWMHKTGQPVYVIDGNIVPFVNDKLGTSGGYIQVQKPITLLFDMSSHMINRYTGSLNDFPLLDGLSHVLLVTQPQGVIYKSDKTPSLFRIVAQAQNRDSYEFDFTENDAHTVCS